MTDYGKVALRKIDELYLSLSRLKSESIEKTSSVSISHGWKNLIGKFSKTLRFRSYDGATILFALYINISTSSKLTLTMDGDVIFSGIIQSGGVVKDIRITGVGSGLHEVELTITGETFNMISMNLTVTGNLYDASGDVFLLPFPTGNYLLKLEMNRLEVISVNDEKLVTGFGVDEVEKVRQCHGSASAFVLVMKTGAVFILDFENSMTKPTLTPVAEQGVCACGIKGQNGIDVFCATENYIKQYHTENGKVEFLGEILVSANDISAWSNGDKTLFIAEKNGFLTLYESMCSIKYTSSDRFTLMYKEE